MQGKNEKKTRVWLFMFSQKDYNNDRLIMVEKNLFGIGKIKKMKLGLVLCEGKYLYDVLYAFG